MKFSAFGAVLLALAWSYITVCTAHPDMLSDLQPRDDFDELIEHLYNREYDYYDAGLSSRHDPEESEQDFGLKLPVTYYFPHGTWKARTSTFHPTPKTVGELRDRLVIEINDNFLKEQAMSAVVRDDVFVDKPGTRETLKDDQATLKGCGITNGKGISATIVDPGLAKTAMRYVKETAGRVVRGAKALVRRP